MYSRLCPSCSAAVVGCVKWQAGHNASGVFASRPRNTRLASANYAYTEAHSTRALSYSSHTARHSKRGVSSIPSSSHPNSDCTRSAYRVPQSPLPCMSSSGLASAAEQPLRLSHARRRVGNTQRAGLGDSSRRSLGSTAGACANNYFKVTHQHQSNKFHGQNLLIRAVLRRSQLDSHGRVSAVGWPALDSRIAQPN